MIVMLFSAGCLTCVAGILRIYYWDFLTRKSRDLLYDSYQLVIWTNLELGISIVCASLPACKVLIQSLMQKRKSRDDSGANPHMLAECDPGLNEKEEKDSLQTEAHIVV
jgi:hypothetical protein